MQQKVSSWNKIRAWLQRVLRLHERPYMGVFFPNHGVVTDLSVTLTSFSVGMKAYVTVAAELTSCLSS